MKTKLTASIVLAVLLCLGAAEAQDVIFGDSGTHDIGYDSSDPWPSEPYDTLWVISSTTVNCGEYGDYGLVTVTTGATVNMYGGTATQIFANWAGEDTAGGTAHIYGGIYHNAVSNWHYINYQNPAGAEFFAYEDEIHIYGTNFQYTEDIEPYNGPGVDPPADPETPWTEWTEITSDGYLPVSSGSLMGTLANGDPLGQEDPDIPGVYFCGGTSIYIHIVDTPDTPETMLVDLKGNIEDETLLGNIEAQMAVSLMAKVDAASAALARGNPNDAKVAMNDLKALINQVEAQTDKKIDPATADAIIAQANAIIAALGG